MDRDDRDHFKTIALASPRPSTDGSQRQERSFSRLDPASCLSSAKMIAACYRRDEAHNPELFADAVALVLADYPADIVRIAVDPRTGIISAFPMGLPNVGQIKQYLDVLLEKQERLRRYAELPKLQKRAYVPPSKQPNLFVPVGFHRYAKMAERHAREPGFCRFESGHTCPDSVARDGLWVPLNWWEQPAKVQHQVGGNDGSSGTA